MKNEPARIDLNSPEQCYFYVWRMFRCDSCGREEKYEEAVRRGGIGQACQKAKEEGWYVPPMTAAGNMDCSAYCAKCAPAERHAAEGAAPADKSMEDLAQKRSFIGDASPPV